MSYNTGILMTSGFSIGAPCPADLKYIANDIAERDNYVTKYLVYDGMLVYVKSEQRTYQYIDGAWMEFSFTLNDFQNNIYDGLVSDSTALALSANQGKILNEKIDTHELNEILHITEDERNEWNDKAPSIIVTTTTKGLMSSEDKIKLDGIEDSANNYVHPDTHDATMIVETEEYQFVSSSEKSLWNRTAYTIATTDNNGLMTAEDKVKLDTLNNEVAILKEQVTTLIQQVEDLKTQLESAVFYNG